MTDQPFISVVTPVYNGADFIAENIESVLAQNYPTFEHIIINDGSTDEGATEAILAQYAHLRTWSRENKGSFATQNEGLKAATGDLVVIINADDVFLPGAFHNVAEAWYKNPTADVIYGKTPRMDADGNRLPVLDFMAIRTRWWLKQYLYFQHCSMFVRRSLIEDHQLHIDATYRHTGDWDWIIRVVQASRKTIYLNQSLAMFRIHSGQISRTDTLERIHAEHKRISQTYGGSYRLHRLFQTFNIYRGLILLGFHKLRTEGFSTTLKLGANWFSRRIKRILR